MATARLTQPELKAKLEALEVHANSSPKVKSFAKDKTERDQEIGGAEAVPGQVVSRFMTTLNGNPATITLPELKDATSYVQNTADIGPTLAPFKARLAVLETHADSPVENKEFLQKVLEKDVRVGHDDQETTDRFNVLLDDPPATIKADRLARLTRRWKDTPP